MRVFFCAGTAMLIGMTAARYFGIFPSIAAAVLCFCAMLITAAFAKRPRKRTLALLFVISVSLLLQTFLTMTAFDARTLDEKTCRIEGTVIKASVSVRGTDYAVVKTDKIDGESRSVEFYMFTDTGFSPYDKIAGDGIFCVNETGFTTVKPAKDGAPIVKSGKSRSIMRYAAEMRSFIASRVKLNVKSTGYPLLIGMVFGDKSLIPDDIYRAFSRSGVSHIFSVSGLHVAIINGIIMLLLSTLGLSAKKRSFASLIALALLTVFVGPSQSVIRAVLMTAIINLANIFSRRGDSLNALGFSVFILLLLDPSAHKDVSFLLTVFATLGIIVLSPPLTGLLPESLPAAAEFFIGAAVISVCAFIGTLPVMLACFPEISIIGPVVNAILSPVFTILMPLCFALCLLSPFGALQPLCAFLGGICTMLFSFVTGFCKITERLPISYIPTGFNFMWICYIIILAIASAAYILKNKLPYIKLTAAALSVSVLLIGGISAKQTLQNNVCVYNISGAHTNGALIMTDTANVLLLFTYDYDSSREIQSALLSRGVNVVDLAVSFKADNKNFKTALRGIPLSCAAFANKNAPEFVFPLNEFSQLFITDLNYKNAMQAKIAVDSENGTDVVFIKDPEISAGYANDMSGVNGALITEETKYDMALVSKTNTHIK